MHLLSLATHDTNLYLTSFPNCRAVSLVQFDKKHITPKRLNSSYLFRTMLRIFSRSIREHGNFFAFLVSENSRLKTLSCNACMLFFLTEKSTTERKRSVA